MRVNGVKLDWQAREVLEAIVEAGGEATTSDVKQYTGIDNETIKYRFRKLARADLVETWQPDSENGRPAAKRVRLVGDVDELLGEEDFEVVPGDDELTLDERVERLEKQTARMRETYGQVKQRIVELEEEHDEFDSELDDLARKLERFIDAFAEADPDSRTSAGDGR